MAQSRPNRFAQLAVCTSTALIPLVAYAAAQADDRRVLIIGVDGLRADAMEQADTPHIDSLYRNGAGYYCRGYNECNTVSFPNWTSVLHGVHRDRHGIHNNNQAPGKDFSAYPNVFARLKRHNPALNTAAVYTWDNLVNNFKNPDGVDYNVLHNMLNPAGVEGVDWQSDDKAAAAMADHLTRGNPHAAYLYLGMPDIIGHRGGFFPTIDRYMRQIETTDLNIGRVLTALRNRPAVKSGDEKWLIVLTTDHGGMENHVTNEYKIREIPFIVHGPGVFSETSPLQPRNVDVVRTVLTFMGVPPENQQDLDGHARGVVRAQNAPVEYGHNLILNGDGEYDRGFDQHSYDQVIAGWQDQQQHPTNGFESMTLMRYGAPEGYPTANDPGPADRGQNFFAGGSQGQVSVMTQTVSLDTLRDAIDAGQVAFALSGWLGGFSNQNDRMELKATFHDANQQSLGEASLAAVTNVDRDNKTGTWFRATTGKLPAGTRKVLLELRAICETGINDGYADNLSFVLTANNRNEP